MRKKAETSVDLHPILAERWSPRSFDGNSTISAVDLTAMLEAARWAPSSNNGQPWRFVVAKRGEYEFSKMIDLLAGFNQIWTPKAVALIMVATKTMNEDGSNRGSALYDAGLAASLLTVEAHHRGFVVRQMGGFDRAAAVTAFELQEGIAPIVILAIGKQAPAESLQDPTLMEREIADRTRIPLQDLIVGGSI